MDTIKDMDANSQADDVTNSTSPKTTNTQQCGLTFLEENNSHCDFVLSDKIGENSETSNAEIIPTADGSWPCNIATVDSLPKQQNIGAICVANRSLLNILDYGGSSSSDETEPESVELIQDLKSSDSSDCDWDAEPSNDTNIQDVRIYRDSRCASSGNTSDSNESLDDDMEVGAIGVARSICKKNIRTEGELELDELPPVPDLSTLSLNVKIEDCIQMGKILSIIDRLVTVESLPNTPAYDLDTLLFLDQGKTALGYVFDVIGQVTSPIYVVRFNSKEEIEHKGITKGLPVYSAPNSEHTQFVFLKELLRMKGSDASWKGDNEVPLEFLDFSDDDVEYVGSKPRKTNVNIARPHKKKRNSLDRHRIFERTMNLKNRVNSAQYKVHNVIEPTGDAIKRNLKFFYNPPFAPPCHVQPPPNRSFFNSYSQNFTMPPNFNLMSMPPPMFNAHVSPYHMVNYPPHPQYPAPTFVSPAIPPLPHMPHVPVQTPPGDHPCNLPVLPTDIPLNVCKPIASRPNVLQNTGVVPKMRRPRILPAAGYYAPNFRPREMNIFANVRPNRPSQPAEGAPNNTGGKAFKNTE